uniref:Uncharacterized protein n=1 Tax=Triticum urartu TaxID=4572 RepID=A0A8R7UWB1_TRIUA
MPVDELAGSSTSWYLASFDLEREETEPRRCTMRRVLQQQEVERRSSSKTKWVQHQTWHGEREAELLEAGEALDFGCAMPQGGGETSAAHGEDRGRGGRG